MFYNSPTYGRIDLNQVKKIISEYMAADKKAEYDVVVGSDSAKDEKDTYDFVTAIIIHRIGAGGIYFWRRELVTKKMSLKERIYQEAIMSLIASENLFSLIKENGISKYDIQIHVDIGHKGETRVLINEVVGMIRASGYDVKIKPYSYGASKVADKYT